MFSKARHNYLVSPLIMALLPVGVVHAQPVPGSGADPGVLEEVVVTGSRIKRQDYVSVSPLVTLDAEQITLSGVTAAEDLVNEAPQLVPDFNRASNNPGTNAAGLNLRGLGSNRTLVTLNGRRMAPADEFGAVDINVIPSQLIKRVEIVTGGASTVYGSDAMAGVVNFILDTEFEGFEVTAQYDSFEEGDGEVEDISMAFGFGNERGHVMGFANYQNREPVFAADRPFTEERLQESFVPGFEGQLLPAGSSTIPAGRIIFPPAFFPGSPAPSQVTFNPDGSPRPFVQGQDQYNFQPANYLQTPLRRDAFALFGHYDVSPTLRAFGEILYSQTSASTQLAPPPAFLMVSVNLDNPLLTPEQRDFLGANYDPAGSGVAMFGFNRRLEETGPRQRTRDADTVRAVVGLEGEFAGDWSWELSYSASRVRGEEINGNSVFADRFAQGLLVDPASGTCIDPSNGCVPFNPFGLQIGDDAANFLRTGDVVGDYEVDEDIINFAVTGDLVELPAGPLGIAAGLEWRELSSERRPDDSFIAGSVLGLNAQGAVEGSTDVAEVFVEALVPILAEAPFAEYLGLEAGYRYSDYRFSGVANNWKAGLDWSPGAGVRFRTMAQRAIRAPNIDELFRQAALQQTALFDTSSDFCSADADPIGRGLTDLCVTQGIPADQVGIYQAQENFPLTNLDGGGNTELDPETADTFTAGVVYQPDWGNGLSMSLDYYRIEIDNAIGSTSLETSLDLCARSNDPAGDFCAPLVRGPSGDITNYTNPQFNLAKLAVEGIDLALNHRFDLGDGLGLPGHGAQLALQVLVNYAMESSQQDTPTNPELDCAGFYGGACAFSNIRIVPEYRSSTRLTYYSGPLSVALNWRWIGALENALSTTCDDFPQLCYPSELENVDADSRNYFELSSRFEFGERAEVFGGISNLTEEDPPLLGFGAVQSNTAPSLYDVFGRRYFLGLRLRL